MEKIKNTNDLKLIPNKHSILLLCYKCSNYMKITSIKAKENIKRNNKYICKTCKQPKAKITRPGREIENIKCSRCKKEFNISKESIKRNIKNNKSYKCSKCAHKQPTRQNKNMPFDNDRNKKNFKHFKQIMASKRVRTNISLASVRNWQNKEYRNKLAKSLAINRSPSNIELALYNILDSFDINYEKEGKNTCFGHWVFDCLIPKQNNMLKHLLIECQGDYWHELSKKQTKDRQKFTFIDKYFPEYEIIYIWEHEFSVKSRIIDRLKLKIETKIKLKNFNFSECTVKQCERNDVKSFLDAYHYIEGYRSGICIGCYLNKQLIAAIIYSSPKQNKTQHRELSRFCIHPSYHKKNFASWFLPQTFKYLDCKLITVCFNSIESKEYFDIYKTVGFVFSHIKQDHWYIDNNNRIITRKTICSKAKKYSMNKKEYINKYGYKKYNGEKIYLTKEI